MSSGWRGFAAALAVGLALSVRAGAGSEATAGPRAQAQALIQGMQADARSGKFKTSGCDRVPPARWASFLLMGEPIRHRLSFKPGCDVEGTLVITREPFPVDLAVRNLRDARRVKGVVETGVETRILQQEIQVTVDFREGRLIGAPSAELAALTAHYDLVTGLDGRPKKNSGGQVRVSTFRGKAIDPVSVPIEIR